MQEPSVRKSRLTLAAVLAAVAVVGGSGFLIGRGSIDPEPAPQVPAPTVPATPPAPTEERDNRDDLMGRGDLIAIAGLAADAVAAGARIPDAVGQAEGRRFRIDLPFGCDGPAAADSGAPMRWRYDPEEQTLRVGVRPVVWQPGDWSTRPASVGTDGSGDAETVEGYWIPRPWTSSEACPPQRQQAAVTGAEAVTLPGQTLALAQFFDTADSRQARRGDKPFESVTRVPPEDVPVDRGFRLRLSGRVAKTPGGLPVACRQPAGSEQRPICVIAVDIDEVTIVNPLSGKALATWTTAEPNTR